MDPTSVPTSTPTMPTVAPITCYSQGPCDPGYIDSTNGNSNYWGCASGCVGGKYYANNACGCACIPDVWGDGCIYPTPSPTTTMPTQVTDAPTTAEPSLYPTNQPSDNPTTSQPTLNPSTYQPSLSPTTHQPSVSPTTTSPTPIGTVCYSQGVCDAGYLDKTNGNYRNWACGSGCSGGAYKTDDSCSCACILDINGNGCIYPPTPSPTAAPTTAQPTSSPTTYFPTMPPTTHQPTGDTVDPTLFPTLSPTVPTISPTDNPTGASYWSDWYYAKSGQTFDNETIFTYAANDSSAYITNIRYQASSSSADTIELGWNNGNSVKPPTLSYVGGHTGYWEVDNPINDCVNTVQIEYTWLPNPNKQVIDWFNFVSSTGTLVGKELWTLFPRIVSGNSPYDCIVEIQIKAGLLSLWYPHALRAKFKPDLIPTPAPTLAPTMTPTDDPTTDPTDTPTEVTQTPTTAVPTSPTTNPTDEPSISPTNMPSMTPTVPTYTPTRNPTYYGYWSPWINAVDYGFRGYSGSNAASFFYSFSQGVDDRHYPISSFCRGGWTQLTMKWSNNVTIGPYPDYDIYNSETCLDVDVSTECFNAINITMYSASTPNYGRMNLAPETTNGRTRWGDGSAFYDDVYTRIEARNEYDCITKLEMRTGAYPANSQEFTYAIRAYFQRDMLPFSTPPTIIYTNRNIRGTNFSNAL